MPKPASWRRSLTAAAAALLVAACGGSDGRFAPPDGFEEVAPVRLQASWYAQWPVRNYVVRNATEWAAVWEEPVSVGNPRPALPPIDFSLDAVVGAANGWGGCESFGIWHVYRRGAEYIAVYGIRPSGASCAAVLVPEVSFVLVPQPVDSVRFERVDE